MPTLNDPEIKALLTLVDAGTIGLDKSVGYKKVCELCPEVRKACVSDICCCCCCLFVVVVVGGGGGCLVGC